MTRVWDDADRDRLKEEAERADHLHEQRLERDRYAPAPRRERTMTEQEAAHRRIYAETGSPRALAAAEATARGELPSTVDPEAFLAEQARTHAHVQVHQLGPVGAGAFMVVGYDADWNESQRTRLTQDGRVLGEADKFPVPDPLETFKIGDRIIDYEGDESTITRFADGRIITDRGWSYREHEIRHADGRDEENRDAS